MANRKTTDPELLKEAETKEDSVNTTDQEKTTEEEETEAKAIRASIEKVKKKKVKLHVPRSKNGNKGPLVVGLNGTIYQLQRGKTVEVDEDVARIIEQSIEQDGKTEELIESLVEKAD